MLNRAGEVLQLRKSGQLDAALERVREAYPQAPQDLYLCRAYGWVIYDLVKRDVQAFGDQRLPAGRLANRLNTWLGEYQQFGGRERPGLAHSLILTQVLKASRDWSGFLAFAQWWDPAFLSEDDRKPYVLPNGKSAPSLALRLHYAIARECLREPDARDPALQAWAEQHLASALAQHPDDPWLNYYQSKRLLLQGQVGQARECLVPVVRRQPRAAWVWTLLGQTFEAEDVDTAITCYFRAVQLARDPMEVAKTRLSLAWHLAQQQRHDEAAVQVQHALDYRSTNGYRLPQALLQLLGSEWYRARQGRQDLPREPDVSAAADHILETAVSRPLVVCLAVVDGQNTAKALAHVTYAVGEGVVLPYHKFQHAAALALGQVVEVGFFQGEHRPSRLRVAEQQQIPGLCQIFSGSLRQCHGQAFGLLTPPGGPKVFVPAELMVQGPEGNPTVVAALTVDRQGRRNWRALRWVRADAHASPPAAAPDDRL